VDYVLYVTSAPCQAGTMAYAGVCAVGGEDDRPIMGAINLCPGAFESLPPMRQLETVLHELLHAFVSGA
jgi:leishmanolysin-like peptidase